MPGGPSAEGKARQRALNGARSEAMGIKPTRSGSSGLSTLLLDMEKKEWAELEPVAEHIADIGGLLYSGQITAAGTLTLQIGCPIEYLHDLSDVAIAGRAGALYFRVYAVTPDSLTRQHPEIADEADEAAADEADDD